MDELDPTDGLRKEPSSPAPGTLIRRLALGSEATYRVLGESDRGVEVEVVEAPGLKPGLRFTFTIADVVKMTEISRSEHATQAMRPAVPRRRYA